MVAPIPSNIALKTRGLKVTHPREVILAYLAKATAEHRHVSAEDLFRDLVGADRSIALATIYRILSDFEQHGMAQSCEIKGRAKVYELVCGPRHDHVVDLETGEVRDFFDEMIDLRKRELAEELGIDIVNYSLTFYKRSRHDKHSAKSPMRRESPGGREPIVP